MTHDAPNPINGKIEIAGEGLGTVTLQMVKQRARELAKSDGRPEPNDADRLLALAECLNGVEPETALEVDERTESLVTWNESPDASGRRVPARPMEDEANVGEKLVEEGIEEADHDQRLSAADKEI